MNNEHAHDCDGFCDQYDDGSFGCQPYGQRPVATNPDGIQYYTDTEQVLTSEWHGTYKVYEMLPVVKRQKVKLYTVRTTTLVPGKDGGVQYLWDYMSENAMPILLAGFNDAGELVE